MTKEIWTIGHSTRTSDEFLALLKQNEIEVLADVRSFPGSRRYPHFGKIALAKSLGAIGISYIHIGDLGGFRKPNKDSQNNNAWRNVAFRGYADHMQTSEFKDAIEALEEAAKDLRIAIMCSEAVPWRCHRSLLSDALIVKGWSIWDIISESEPKQRELTSFARVAGYEITYPKA